jgi:hypothetical protein
LFENFTLLRGELEEGSERRDEGEGIGMEMLKISDEDLLTRNGMESCFKIEKIHFNTTKEFINILEKSSGESRDGGILSGRIRSHKEFTTNRYIPSKDKILHIEKNAIQCLKVNKIRMVHCTTTVPVSLSRIMTIDHQTEREAV